ncbi:unnamed protein product [Adineta steineri]|uniref:G-protein coupled receptors family 1 profile domain-containing protein n=1 Tax=Adineta steineri TaxID=433720 RepID=A0A819HQU1_9BILA|nr:unnamed protein product [Adineta steineri]CAF3902107.1 unnamed protein product [Adineta steineri]
MPSSSVSDGILNFATQFSFYSGFVTFGFGVIGNVLNLLVFIQLKLFRTGGCAFYITIESISNLIYFCFNITITILPLIYGNAAIGSSNALIALGSSYNVQPTLGCVLSNYVAIQYSTYFFYPVLGGFLPIVIASTFSALAYHNVRRIVQRQLPIVRRKLDKQITAMVLMRVIAFVCLLVPYITYRIYAINFPIPPSMPMPFAIGRLFQAIFTSINLINYFISFYLFIIFSPRFRRQMKLVLVKKCWQRWKSWCCHTNNRIEPFNTEPRNLEVESVESI